ncbi:MAG: hypothetical protein LBP52_05655 [Burkholderiaceae bacterium]|jgi:hypothetical protein|nr:hypothetical protein [Burkholderiaceae bacterium]
MRASLIGRFLLTAIVCLAILLPLWYKAVAWFAMPPIWLAGRIMKAAFPWVKGFGQENSVAVLHTNVQMRILRGGYDTLVELTSRIDYSMYGYGVVLLWAMLLASRPRYWPLKALLGTVLLIPVQAWGLCFQWMKNILLDSGPNAAAYLDFPAWGLNAVVYGYQFGVLMLTPVAPILLWLWFDKRFVAALWLEAALEGKPEQKRKTATTMAVPPPPDGSGGA